MLDELNLIAGGSGDDTDDVAIAVENANEGLLEIIGSAVLATAASYYVSAYFHSLDLEGKVNEQFNPNMISYSGTLYKDVLGVPAGTPFWVMTDEKMFFDLNKNSSPDFLIFKDENLNLWSFDGSSKKLINDR